MENSKTQNPVMQDSGFQPLALKKGKWYELYFFELVTVREAVQLTLYVEVEANASNNNLGDK